MEVEESLTVKELKEMANSTHSLGEPELLKLIYTGKVLKDDQTVGSANIKDGGFIVVMVSKKKKKPAAAPAAAAAAPAPEAAAAAPAPAPASAAPAPAAAAAPAPAAAQPAPAQPNAAPGSDSGLVRGPQYEAAVESLMALGFERPQVVRALQASFNNPDRAAEYLFSGIPEGLLPQQAPAAAAPAAPDAQGQAAPAAAPTGAAPSGAPQQMDIAALQQMIQARPEILDALINQIAQTNPQLMQVIGQNREAFAQMLQDPQMLARLIGSGALGGGPPQNVVQITEEERQAIERLEALGFSREHVVEAYLACDKNEELAANYLFDHGHDDSAQ